MAPEKAVFLANVADSADTIAQMRQQIEALEQEIGERQAQVDELNRKLTALNGLRAAYGYPPA